MSMTTSPAGPAATQPAQQQISEKVYSISERIMRGKWAVNSRQVLFYNCYRVVTVVLTVLGGVGITLGHPRADVLSTSGGPFAVGIASLTIAILVKLYKMFNVEKKANAALSARDSFIVVEENLRSHLEAEEPINNLIELLAEAQALSRNFSLVLYPVTKEIEQEAQQLRDSLIAKYSGRWKLPALPPGGRF